MPDGAHEHLIDAEVDKTRFDFAARGRQKREFAKFARLSRELGQKPRVAYTGEEYGFGFSAIQVFSATVQGTKGYLPDGGYAASSSFHAGPLEILKASLLGSVPASCYRSHNSFSASGAAGDPPIDIDVAYRQPARTKAQALAAIEADSAEYALVPFYQAGSGYDTETVELLSKMFSPFGVFQVEASDHFCLAVYEPQVLDIVHAAHPGSGLTDILRRRRRSWDGPHDRGATVTFGESPTSTPEYQAGLNIDRASQLMLRDRVETIFAGPEASRRCRARLDGFRAGGVKIEDTAGWVEPHREMARRVRDSLDGGRQTVQSLDPLTGGLRFTSLGTSAAQSRPLYGIVLPFEVASRSPEFAIIDDNLEDAVPPKKRFLVVQKVYDLSLFEEVFRLTPLRVGYWLQRLLAVRQDAQEEALWRHEPEHPGVRILVQFGRQGPVTTIGDVEEFLRRFGVRYSIFQMGDSTLDSPRPKVPGSSASSPSPIVLDIEFDEHHFTDHYNDGLISRSIVEGFLFKAFNRSRHSMARILAAFPYEKPQLLPQARHRWWFEGIRLSAQTWAEETETLLGPVFGGIITAPIKFGAKIVTGAFAIAANLFDPDVRGWVFGGGVLTAFALTYWNTPIGVILEQWRALFLALSGIGGSAV